jgi:2-polyprenyl-3-methyl-5-hydroxy-6-metoxy-1,4-benzoquinol methylase
MAYLTPRPTRQLFGIIYPDTYGAYQSQVLGFRARLKKWVMQASFSKDTRKNALMRQLVKLLASQVMTFVPAARGEQRLLDIGCGSGDFLEQAQAAGWRVWGVEPSPVGAQRAQRRGFKVSCGELEEAKFPEKFFDMISMSHVIEHLDNPVAELRRCRSLLKDDGKLLVVTPNFDCFDRHTFGPYWIPLMVPEHIGFFSVQTLRDVLKRAGFAVESTKFNFLPHKLSDFSAINLKPLVRDYGRLGFALGPKLARAIIRTFLIKPWLWLCPGNRPYLGDTMTMMAVKNLAGA